MTITEGGFLVSVDVVSLFTSIPQDLATGVIAKRLERIPDTVDMSNEKLIELLGLCLKTHFTFDGTTYEQVKGTPMGSPVSSVIAEETAFRICPPTRPH